MAESTGDVVSFGKKRTFNEGAQKWKTEQKEWGQKLARLQRIQAKKTDPRLPLWISHATRKMLEAKSHAEYFEQEVHRG